MSDVVGIEAESFDPDKASRADDQPILWRHIVGDAVVYGYRDKDGVDSFAAVDITGAAADPADALVMKAHVEYWVFPGNFSYSVYPDLQADAPRDQFRVEVTADGFTGVRVK